MAEISVVVDAKYIHIEGQNFEVDVPTGVHVHFAPDDHSQGRNGNLNFIPGPETSGGPGAIQPGLYTDDNGEFQFRLTRHMVISNAHIPGVLTVTVYQDPELIGQEFAAQISQEITS